MMDRRIVFGHDLGLSGEVPGIRERVEDELALYPGSAGTQLPRLDISFVDALPDEGGYVNPGIHLDQPDGFTADYGSMVVRFQAAEDGRLARASVMVRRSEGLGALLYRAQHIQYTTIEDMVGQLLHELVLVPSVYFQHGMALIHAAAVQAEDGAVTLIGGTGGVGKTSLELELCRRRGMRFVADDISVIDSAGRIWPNLSYPKIYGYNVVDDPGLKRDLLKGVGPVNRMQWEVKNRRSPSRVRRRRSPLEIYGDHSRNGGPLRRYVLIVRDRAPGIDCRPIAPAEAAKMSLSVMQTEYNVFDNQVRWHEYNRIAQEKTPILTMDGVRDKWAGVYASALKQAECLLLRASKDIPHKTFVTKAADMVTQAYEEIVHE